MSTVEIARSGSFRPWPVRVQTTVSPRATRPPSTARSRPATGVAEAVDDLEGGRLLTLEPVGVHGVDQRDGVLGGQLPDDGEGLVEVALDLDHLGPVDQRLGQLAEGDVALGDEHGADDAGSRR